jgi:hypothetical protein
MAWVESREADRENFAFRSLPNLMDSGPAIKSLYSFDASLA